uniref:Uncharacterized protein n=1 Tax=Anguilla anguilla TaxID=7936 RepID=A0A0E9QCA8_ANGAN
MWYLLELYVYSMLYNVYFCMVSCYNFFQWSVIFEQYIFSSIIPYMLCLLYNIQCK